ncbi:uncharacterized protein LOC116847811 isoform X2 [Odontomachus brunneus]|uniref:uncharacterized protein LOC116847811 isoform X2 n=1 Tax=Odontomachus brunneus TaxID=486640 RepID=UPI0013F1E2B5|nr:uncharacterized protein LOC116847811 isoform X2 [Odontomachus brunneus]
MKAIIIKASENNIIYASLNHKFIAMITSLYLTILTSFVTIKSKQKRRKGWKENIKENESKIAYPKITSSEQRREHQDIVELKIPRWVKIGKVASLHVYPLISGKAYVVDECHMTSEKIKMYKKGKLIKWDRSFVVYDVINKYIITTGNFPQLNKVCVSVNKNDIILETIGMPTICVKFKNRKIIRCNFWSNKELQLLAKITCIDCGDEAARWLSSFLCGLNVGLRLGYSIDAALIMNIYWQHWLRNCILHQKAESHTFSLNPFVNVLHSIMISSESYDDMSKTLNIYKPNEMICPNIIISASNLYKEKVWEWIKIGNVIIKNIQPLVVWPRRIIKNEVCELQKMRLFGFGVNCKVYLPGCIKLDDDVYLHIPKDKEEVEDIEKVEDIKEVTK